MPGRVALDVKERRPPPTRARRRSDRRRDPRRRRGASCRRARRRSPRAVPSRRARARRRPRARRARRSGAPAPCRRRRASLGRRSRAEQERRRDHRARDVRAREAGAPHLLGQEHDVEDGPVAAAEVAGDEQSRPAELAELRPQRAAVLVQRLASGRRLERAVAGEEVAGRALQESLAVGRAEVHRSAPAVSARSAGRGPASPRWCAGSRRCRRRWCGRGSSSRRAGSIPRSGAQREASVRGAKGPSRSMAKAASFWPSSSAITLARADSWRTGSPVSIMAPTR